MDTYVGRASFNVEQYIARFKWGYSATAIDGQPGYMWLNMGTSWLNPGNNSSNPPSAQFKPATHGAFSSINGNIGRYLALNTPNTWQYAEVIPLDPQGNPPELIFRNRIYS